MHGGSGYGLWTLVVLNSAVFIIFAFSFTKPKTSRDWRSLGAFSAFVVALFTEMYGFPLTVYLLSGWLQTRFPETNVFSHDAGHLWNTLLGWDINPHFDPLHILSNVVIFGGFIMLASAWRVLHTAQRAGELAVDGLYARMRHPQYVAFVVIMFGFLLQWPTLLTLAMFPVLLWMYSRLSISEEREAEETFGEAWRHYADNTPRFLPRLRGLGRQA